VPAILLQRAADRGLGVKPGIPGQPFRHRSRVLDCIRGACRAEEEFLHRFLVQRDTAFIEAREEQILLPVV